MKAQIEDPDDSDLLGCCWARAHADFAVDVFNDFCTLGPLSI